MIPLFKPYMAPDVLNALEITMGSGMIGDGPRVKDFEESLSNYLGRKALAVTCGTAALHIALEMCRVRGREVVSTPMTAEPTNTAILQAGGKVVWADVDINGNICPESIQQVITPETAAIMVVHYSGIPCRMNAIWDIAHHHHIPVIEDCAHALGARYQYSFVGTRSEYGCFSFQAIKHLPLGDGGALVCGDMKRAKLLRWFGIDREGERTAIDVKMLGYKYNMNDITATIGLAQMNHIEEVVDRHISNGLFMWGQLLKVPGLYPLDWETHCIPSFWLYTLVADRRDDLARKLTERGIGNSLCHKRNDQHSIFADSKRPLPGLDWFYAHMLHIPCGWWVTDEDRDYIVKTIKEGW